MISSYCLRNSLSPHFNLTKSHLPRNNFPIKFPPLPPKPAFSPILRLKSLNLSYPFVSISSFAEPGGEKEEIQAQKHEEKAGKMDENDLPGMAKAFNISSTTASAISVVIAFAALSLPLFMQSLGPGLALKAKVLYYATLLFGFYMAWNIGANDVANAMGTSVGSWALSLRQAVLTAVILEFSGALLTGTHVTSTMQKGILVANVFWGKDSLLFAGLLSSLAAAGTW